MTAKPLIIYHRGRHGKVGARTIPENTLEAFEAAVVEGAQMVEFDIWTGLRIAHDPGENATAPTLKQALEAIDGRISVNLEIKSPAAVPDAILAIKAALQSKRWSPKQIVVSSFHHKSALAIKRQMPEIRCGVINDGVLQPVYLEWLAKRGISNLHIEWMNVYMDIEDQCQFREWARSFGFAIWVWTVNDREKFQTMADYGADAVFTDRPDLLKCQRKETANDPAH